MFFYFSNLGTIFTLWNGSNLGLPGISVVLYGFSSLWCPFDWNWSYLSFLGIIWRTRGSKCRRGSGGMFLTLCVEFWLVIFKIKNIAKNCVSIQGTLCCHTWNFTDDLEKQSQWANRKLTLILFSKVITHGPKRNNLSPIWAFPDANSNLNSWMFMKLHT